MDLMLVLVGTNTCIKLHSMPLINALNAETSGSNSILGLFVGYVLITCSEFIFSFGIRPTQS